MQTTTTEKPLRKKQAVDGRRLNAFAVNPDTLTVIGLDTSDGDEHPLYDERIHLPLDESLIASFRTHGVLDEVHVRKVAGRLEVVDGRRRVINCREANRRLIAEGEPTIEVKIMIEKGPDDYMEAASILLNELRRSDEIMLKAKKAVRYLRRTQDDYAQVALAFGVDKNTIKRWEKLVELPCNVRKAIEKGQITVSAAVKLHGLEGDDLNTALQELVECDKPTVDTADRIARGKKNGGDAPIKPKAPSKKVMRKLVAAEDTKWLSADFLTGVRWALGDIEASEVPGLEALLEKL